MPSPSYDVIVVGAGIAGSALVHALSTITSASRSTPLRVALFERSLAEPDRIVGELLQPGGVKALKKLGMEECLEGIDAVPVHGYCVYQAGQSVRIPYPSGHQGRSFHHGRFIMRLREKASQAEGVEMIEATVTDLVECELTRRIIGIKAKRDGTKETFFADLIVIADGCSSNFRRSVMLHGAGGKARISERSHFYGAILKDVRLPIHRHGTVALVKGHGPVLLYQISEHDTRMLVDIKLPLPSDLKSHVLTNVVPHLPPALHIPIHESLDKDRLRGMPNSFLPAVEQGGRRSKEGAILLGDAWNMRHPLTGGGMTVALNDVVILSQLLGQAEDLGDWDEVSDLLHDWHWGRKPLSSTINILSVALYDLFGAESDELEVLRTGCFKYFERGGECINGPSSLLSGIIPSPVLLANHFFAVAFYSIWILFTHPRPVPSSCSTDDEQKPNLKFVRIEEYPELLLKSVRVFWTACLVFGPLLWTEIRWW